MINLKVMSGFGKFEGIQGKEIEMKSGLKRKNEGK